MKTATTGWLFLFQQIGEEIDYESYVRVKHRNTGTWLHLNKGMVYNYIVYMTKNSKDSKFLCPALKGIIMSFH